MSKPIFLLLALLLLFTACSNEKIAGGSVQTVSSNGKGNEEYINKIVFLGESTTYHLKSRGVLEGGTKTTQVWSPKSGTLMLDMTTFECRILYPESNEELELSDALKKKLPEYMMLTFGLNGASGFIKKGEKYFSSCYQKLIDTIKTASPKTSIIINSCFPIAKNMDMSNYKINAKELNAYIDKINVWAKKVADSNGLKYLNSASVLKNKEGFLKSEYQEKDGFHLNVSAYKVILAYIKDNA